MRVLTFIFLFQLLHHLVVDNLLLFKLEFLLLSQPLLVVSFKNFLLFDLILNFRLFLLIIRKAIGLFRMQLLSFLDKFMDIEFESLWEHLVDHCNLIGVCIEVPQFIFFFLFLLVFIIFDIRNNI